MNISSARYTTNLEGDNTAIKCIIDGETIHVPLQEGNRHYDEIMRQVAAGELTIEDAD